MVVFSGPLHLMASSEVFLVGTSLRAFDGYFKSWCFLRRTSLRASGGYFKLRVGSRPEMAFGLARAGAFDSVNTDGIAIAMPPFR